MPKPAPPAPPIAPKEDVETFHGIVVRKGGADQRFYVERVEISGDKVTSRKVVADDFTFESLCVDATIKLRQLLGDVFNPLSRK